MQQPTICIEEISKEAQAAPTATQDMIFSKDYINSTAVAGEEKFQKISGANNNEYKSRSKERSSKFLKRRCISKLSTPNITKILN